MAQARRKSSGSASRKGRGRGLLLLVLGVGIGIGGVYLWQQLSKRIETRSGIVRLFTSSQPAEKPVEPAKPESAKKDRDAGKGPKPKYEFYTLLQNETVLPDRESPREKTAKSAKPDEGVSYILQAGSYVTFEDADQLKARLAFAGLVAHIQKVEMDGKTFHRVRVGPYERIEQLDAAADQLARLGIRALRLKVRKGAGA
jgi:cell division protein FtsN